MKKKGTGVKLWSALSVVTAILLVAVIIGTSYANRYATTINVALGIETTKIIKGEDSGDTEYFKSDFASDDERVKYEEELCARVESEGAALLKNDNQALPLSSGALSVETPPDPVPPYIRSTDPLAKRLTFAPELSGSA